VNLSRVLVMYAWIPFGVLFVLFLPVGERQVRCECYHPKFKLFVPAWRWLRGIQPNCDSTCHERRRWDHSKDWVFEFSWSAFILDACVWCYAMVFAMWLVGILLCVVLAVTIVIVALIIAVCFAILNLCQDSPECGSVDCIMFPYCDCTGCFDTTIFHNPVDDYLLFGGSRPGVTSSSRCPKCVLCWPVTFLLVRTPSPPANMWGGLIGRLIGTHLFSQNPYVSGNWWIDLLSFRTSGAHDDGEWRTQLHDYIWGNVPHAAEIPPPEQIVVDAERPTRVEFKPRNDFHKEDCDPSTWEDFQQNHCWLCEQSKDEWAMWCVCGHLLCKGCTEELTRRHMPCPLCRKVSHVILTTVRTNSLQQPLMQRP